MAGNGRSQRMLQIKMQVRSQPCYLDARFPDVGMNRNRGPWNKRTLHQRLGAPDAAIGAASDVDSRSWCTSTRILLQLPGVWLTRNLTRPHPGFKHGNERTNHTAVRSVVAFGIFATDVSTVVDNGTTGPNTLANTKVSSKVSRGRNC